MKNKNLSSAVNRAKNLKVNLPYLVLTFLLLSLSVNALATDDLKGFEGATTKLKTYFNYGVDLMYVIGGVVGLIGGIKVYNKWNHGDPDTSKAAASWFGSCLFLLIVASVLRGFFGL
jgi:Domain of unknown function (DUF4134)